jgi:hypothetical protein
MRGAVEVLGRAIGEVLGIDVVVVLGDEGARFLGAAGGEALVGDAQHLLEERLLLLVRGKCMERVARRKPLLSSNPRPSILAARSGRSSRNAHLAAILVPTQEVHNASHHEGRRRGPGLRALPGARPRPGRHPRQDQEDRHDHRRPPRCVDPFSYYDDKQQPVGYAMDICAAIVEAVKKQVPNLKVNYQLVTSANRIPLMANGTIDMECGSTTNNNERQQQVSFTNTHFIPANRWVSKKSANLKSLNDLKGKTIVSTRARATSS